MAHGNAHGCRSLEKKSGLGDKLVSVFNQDVSESSRLFGHYLLVVGIRLFTQFVMNDEISLEKEWDFWDFWDSPHNDRSNELNNVIAGRDATRKRHVDATQTILFLEGAVVELFVQYSRIGVKYREDTVKNGRKRLICRSMDRFSASRSLVLARLHLSQALKTRG